MLGATAATASPGPPLAVEIGARAERLVDARFTRRLIELEISDVELPPEPRTGLPTALFFRVLAVRGDALRIELWERGQLHGARTVSPKGNAKLIARRVALAAAELTRQVSSKRRDQARALAIREAQRRAAATAAADAEQRGLGLIAAGRAATIGVADAWLVGPELGLRLYPRPRLGLGLAAALLEGSFPALDTGLRWAELVLDVRYRVLVQPSLGLDLGARAAAALLHLPSVDSVDQRDRRDSASARAVGLVALSGRVGRALRLEAAPEVGFVLRPVPARTDAGSGELSGLWLGLGLGVSHGL